MAAHEIWGNHVKVWSEGRSGGWAVVAGLPDFDSWDAIDLAKWRKFARIARNTADHIPEATMTDIYFNFFKD